MSLLQLLDIRLVKHPRGLDGIGATEDGLDSLPLCLQGADGVGVGLEIGGVGGEDGFDLGLTVGGGLTYQVAGESGVTQIDL